MPRSPQILIALGSNLKPREYHLNLAIDQLGLHGQILRRSAWFQTAPVGPADRPFLNGALIWQPDNPWLRPDEVMELCLKIEASAGRTRTIHWGNRTLDLDLLLWRRSDGQSEKICSPTLTIPHPEMLNRAFVLHPAAAIAPHWWHPQVGKTLAEIWRDLQRPMFLAKSAAGPQDSHSDLAPEAVPDESHSR